MFSNCIMFNQDLSKWNISNLETADFMFCHCNNLTYNLSELIEPTPAINNYNVAGMFNGVKSKLPKWYE